MVTYIDGTKAVASKTVVDGTALALKVNYNNDSKANVSIPATNAKYQIVNNKTGAVAHSGNLNAAALVALAGNSVELGSIINTVAVGKYTVIVTVKDTNDNVSEAELALTVQSKDASVSAVKVKDVAATGTSPNFAVVLPYGLALKDVKASDIVVTPTNDKATVGVATTDNEGATWKVVVTAEDGETKTNLVITPEIAKVNTTKPFMTTLVLSGGAQVAADAADIQAALEQKLTDLQALSLADAATQGRDDITTIMGYVAADVKFNASNITITQDKVTITGPVFSEAAFKVAKGAKTSSYNTTFNISVYQDGTGTPGNAVMIAKIQISADGTAVVVAQ